MTNPYEVLDQSENSSNEQAIQNTETKQEINTTPSQKGTGKIFDSLAIFFAKLMGHPNPITGEKFKEEEKIISEKTEKKLEDIMGNVGNLLEKVGDKAIQKVNETAKNINEKLSTPSNQQIKLDDIENNDTQEIQTQDTQIQEEVKPVIQEESKLTPTKREEPKQEIKETQNEIKK